MRTLCTLIAAAALGVATLGDAAGGGYSVNGQPMPAAYAQFFASVGMPPGDYQVDPQGFVYAPGQNQPFTRIQVPAAVGGYYQGPIASGNAYQDGSSSIYMPDPSGAPGFSAAQDSDGCIYMTGWSNC